MLVLLGLSSHAAAVPPLQPAEPQPERDVCNPVNPGETIVDARVVSFEQAHYTCGPYQGPPNDWDGWMEMLHSIDSSPAPLEPTKSTGCIFLDGVNVALTSRTEEVARSTGKLELRIDGEPRAVPYVTSWMTCGLAPGRHTIEMPTDMEPLTCEGDVRAGETLMLAGTLRRVQLEIEPTRLVAGASRPEQRLTVEYDEANLRSDTHMHGGRLDGPLPTSRFRLWTTLDGVLHAERCPVHLAAALPPPPPSNVAPRTVRPSGCAHCAVGDADPSESMVIALGVLALVIGKRSCNNRCS